MTDEEKAEERESNTKEYRVDIQTYKNGSRYSHFSIFLDAKSEDDARNEALDLCDFVEYDKAEAIVRQDY